MITIKVPSPLKANRTVVALLAFLLLASGCKSGAVSRTDSNNLYPEPAMTEEPVEPMVVKTVSVEKEAYSSVADSAYPGPLASAQSEFLEYAASAAGAQKDALIVKTADLRLLVEDTPQAIDAITRIVEDVEGFIASSRVWYQEELEARYQYAALTIRVPVAEFEPAMRRIRASGSFVLDESTTGQDVTGEYIDLESQLKNLQATRDRIRTFLDQAETAEEALNVNEKLTQVEAEIAQIEGRMNNLYDQAAYSTITVNLEPELPAAEALPTPTAAAWSPGDTAAQAAGQLVELSQNLVDRLIWFSIVVLPFLIVLALVVWAVVAVRRRRRRGQRASMEENNPDIEG